MSSKFISKGIDSISVNNPTFYFLVCYPSYNANSNSTAYSTLSALGNT